MFDTAVRTIGQYGLLKKDEPILAAVSGGADSMSLLHVLIRFGARVTAVHIEHGIRGEDSLRDARFVQDYCQEHGIPFVLSHVDAPSYAKEKNLSMELAARCLRYNALYNTAYGLKLNKIALAHNSNDQAETLLFRFIRGSGTAGLCGMQPIRENETERYGKMALIRPLLFVSRNGIEQYCRENDIPYITDSTNNDASYTRNYLRHEVLPLLYKLNPAINETLSRSAQLYCEDEECLTELAQRLERQVLQVKADRGELDLSGLLTAPRAVVSRVIRSALEQFRSKTDIEQVHIEAVLNLIYSGQTGKTLNLPHGITVSTAYGLLIFSDPFLPPVDEVIPLQLEKPMYLGKLELFASLSDAPMPIIHNQAEEFLDYDRLPEDLVLRHRKDGDRIHPLGMTGQKKLKDYFIDKKLTKQARSEAVLLAKNSEVFAVIGQTVSSKAAVVDQTKKILHIKITNRS